MQYQENISLKAFNTFGIDVMARYFGRFNSTDELQQAIAGNGKTEVLLLGGGSNLLFTGNFDGLVLKNEVRGVRKIWVVRFHPLHYWPRVCCCSM